MGGQPGAGDGRLRGRGGGGSLPIYGQAREAACYLLEGRALIASTWAGLQDGFMKTAPFNTKPCSPRSLRAAQRPSFSVCFLHPPYPYRLTPAPPPAAPFKASQSSNYNPDVNSNLKIISDHPFPPNMSGEGI